MHGNYRGWKTLQFYTQTKSNKTQWCTMPMVMALLKLFSLHNYLMPNQLKWHYSTAYTHFLTNLEPSIPYIAKYGPDDDHKYGSGWYTPSGVFQASVLSSQNSIHTEWSTSGVHNIVYFTNSVRLPPREAYRTAVKCSSVVTKTLKISSILPLSSTQASTSTSRGV